MTPREVVQAYVERNFHLTFWPQSGDDKGPREPSWPKHPKTLADWHEGLRVGIVTGSEVAPGKFIHDVDLDWAAGSSIAQAMLPATGFVFGRASKRVSHCFYTCGEPLKSFKYEDADKTCLIELRGTKANGDLGLQTMSPPSVWSKGKTKEPLAFVRFEGPAHVEGSLLQTRVTLAAIGMLLAKHFGHNGFGHETRLCWAGFLLRAGISLDDLVTMGEAISAYCNNREVSDVRRVLESTAASLAIDSKKVKGGPALAKLVGKPTVNRINEWLGRDQDFVRDQEGRIVARHSGNIKRAVELLGHELAYNQFADKLLLDGKPMEDLEVNHLLLQIETEYRFQPPDQYYRMVINDAAWQNSFHPVKDYLATLTWDGVPRVDHWLREAAGAEENEYVQTVSGILLIAAVRRVMHPGCKYDEMLVLESKQGTGKSTMVQALCPNPAWFSDDLPLNLKSQQLIEATLGKWIVEASDLAGKRKAEQDHLKAMLSRQVDGPARMAYARLPVERPRHFVIIGTTNSPVYLPDQTGARRFWPVTVRAINVEWVLANRDQLWAEAVVREREGASIRLPERLWPQAAAEQEQRREIDPWEQAIHEHLLLLDVDSLGMRRVPTSDLWQAIGVPIERQDRVGQLRISEIMQRFGFKRTTVRVEGAVRTGFKQVEVELLAHPSVDDEDEGPVVRTRQEDVPF